MVRIAALVKHCPVVRIREVTGVTVVIANRGGWLDLDVAEPGRWEIPSQSCHGEAGPGLGRGSCSRGV